MNSLISEYIDLESILLAPRIILYALGLSTFALFMNLIGLSMVQSTLPLQLANPLGISWYLFFFALAINLGITICLSKRIESIYRGAIIGFCAVFLGLAPPEIAVFFATIGTGKGIVFFGSIILAIGFIALVVCFAVMTFAFGGLETFSTPGRGPSVKKVEKVTEKVKNASKKEKVNSPKEKTSAPNEAPFIAKRGQSVKEMESRHGTLKSESTRFGTLQSFKGSSSRKATALFSCKNHLTKIKQTHLIRMKYRLKREMNLM
jgi:hypothetical protein